MTTPPDAVILISANAEWQPVRARYPDAAIEPTPYGECFTASLPLTDGRRSPVVFFHGGWGKIDAAAGTQYAIDRWRPALLINLGTCGGFAGDIAAGEVLLVDFTLVYDIVEQMGDPDEALAHYATAIDLSWLGRPWPLAARQELLVSADRDIVAGEVADLRARYGAIAADWESGAIAHVCGRNGTRCLILRAVTDLVSHETGEAYGRLDLFAARAAEVMGRLVDSLPGWLEMQRRESTDYTDSTD
ncbi:putative Adenosylhomocysteine nucleosidase [Candidatus Promineifilum breve]|uniref:Adenosylhomocysteine nucleosidase n=1 Tax=Candidatus Promineifilum breve TaxID=1806508 RepID=A0A160T5D0_9CHLR|nr:5'-methylthioadenosine/S-adenosylhomocysteine nucleosidase [Candidatus Promineifilum breve]CUS05581.1 putative Adenosylhomocysteine nucleosidase [Candidatus Promineifilum breve]